MNDPFLFCDDDDDGVNDVEQEAGVDVFYYVGYSYVCVYPDSSRNSYPMILASMPDSIYGPGYSDGY